MLRKAVYSKYTGKQLLFGEGGRNSLKALGSSVFLGQQYILQVIGQRGITTQLLIKVGIPPIKSDKHKKGILKKN
jgi:hypothetical protein